jgi:hypothetical protein
MLELTHGPGCKVPSFPPQETFPRQGKGTGERGALAQLDGLGVPSNYFFRWNYTIPGHVLLVQRKRGLQCVEDHRFIDGRDVQRDKDTNMQGLC